ncbi:vacuolar protein sorting-associated protein 13A isoform X2 [Sardina pilchardus]|uniref:vacuolar protein sorting-associated protein 13A isoform X2 n=1 Tax=Sardina pilchardus TaxID=27697 RepID=UPI002E13C7EC
MVFESVVVDVLNRFLGDYVVNLDSSQLSLGIWGGDAILKNLEIKENALSQLDIPFKVRAGHIGRLELKIPWKNLYTQSVEATLDEVYLLIVPTASIKYDAEKEERQLQEARQRELQRIEETKQRAAEQENPQLQKQDTFVEKLVTQVIKNLQVKISNIHIRYEDDITNPSSPISFGVSLQNLSLQTADANWTPCLLDDKAKLFFKLVRLDDLFAYWNTNSELYSNHTPDQALRCLRHNVAVEGSIPQDYQYVIRPISARAKLRMNPRSDVDLSAPKVDLMVNLPDVSVVLSRPQYVSILELLGSVDMMSRNLPYRKYRPDLPLHNNAFLWWRYVIVGILEVNVKPRLRMWSWQHIRHHRQTVKRYRELYKHKITNKKPMESMLKELEETEKTLDIFNITLARQQAEVEAMRAGLPIIRPGQKAEVEESQGWFGWMWGWGSEAPPESKETVKTGGFDELMTPAEKDKLYKAIGYSEIAVNHNLPREFVDMKVSFQLVSMSVSLKESSDKPEILKLAVMDLSAMLTQRPGAQAFGVSAQLMSFEVTGLPRNHAAPILLSSRRVAVGNNNPLLTLKFETNPLDGSADQKLHADAQPLEIIYDAVTVNSLSTFFLLPDDVQLDELTNATLMKLEQFKDRTATGLMYVIETQKVLDLRVNLMASYVIVPQGGFYSGQENLILLDLGHLQMSSKTREGLPHLSVGSSTLEDIMSRAYDSFDIQLSNLQFLFSKADGDWRAARKLKRSSLHVLEPVDLRVELSRAMVVTDSRMPKFKISGELPLLSLRISDDKVRGVLALVDSIPLPESRPTPTPKPSVIQLTPKPSRQMTTPQVNPRKPTLAEMRTSMFYDAISLTSMSSEEELFFDAPSSPVREQGPFLFEAPPSSLSRSASLRQRTMLSPEPPKNMTDFLISFMIHKLSIQLCRASDLEEVTVLHLSIEGLGAELKKRTFDIQAETFLKEICLACPEYTDAEDKPVHLVTTLDNTEDDLLIFQYTKADKTGPEFKTVYNNTEQLVKVNFSSLDVHLYTEALVNTMNFLTNLLPPSSPEPAPAPADDEQGEGEGDEDEEKEEKKEGSAVVKAVSKKSKGEDGEVVNMHIRADLSSLKVFIRGEKARIAEVHIEGLVSEVVMKKKAMEVQANLRNIIILDCDKEALYQKAVSIADKEVFAFRMVNYTEATQGDAYKDMSCVDTDVSLTVGCIQLIFLYKFFSSILTFVDNFQTAKAALAEVTAQAAEKAAVGVRELAERSSRISLAVHINAPVLFLPQSSSSPNVIVADLGRMVVSNEFAMEAVTSPLRTAIPPITDNMKVELSHLKMYRTTFADGKFQSEVELLKPVNMDLTIKRNLSAGWYHNIPDIQIDAHLRPMSLVLSQEDLSVVLLTLSENLSETAESTPTTAPPDKADTTSNKENTVVISAVVEAQQSAKMGTKLKLNFKFDSLTLLLYSPAKTPQQDAREPGLMLAEFTLGSIHTQLRQQADGTMNATVRLSECLLDDKRSHVKSVTSRMMALRPGAEKSVMLELSYRAGREGTSLEVALQDLYLCASMEFLLTVVNVFLEALANGRPATPRNGRPANASSSATSTKDTVPAQLPTVLRNTYSVVVKNPEIVFVADLTRPDAPALVMTTQVEAQYHDGPDGQRLTAGISDLKVTACPFLRQQRKPNHVTTVLQPCQLFFSHHTPTGQPQSMEISIEALTLKVSPIIINTVITIQSALTPATEGGEGEQKESPMPPDLWEHCDLRQLKLWFLEEEGEEDTRSLTPLVPQGDTLKLGIGDICLTLEAGVGHRTVPMLLAKASFHGDAKNLSTLINLHSTLKLEVHYYNEIMGVWEPLLEPLEDETSDGFRPWSLELKMKKKPLKYSGIGDEVDFSVPDYKTVITVSSKDQLNIMLSKCGLNMLSNLGMAFAAATQSAESFQRDQAPLVLKNRLGVALSVLLSDMFVPLVPETHGDSVTLNRSKSTDRQVELLDGQNLYMDFASDQFSAMTSLNAKNYFIQPTPVGHSEASAIPLIKVGRGMYSVLHNESHVTRFFVCQIYSAEGSKYVKIRSPFQIINHSTVSFRVFEGSTCLGTSRPTEEFCVPLGSYRAQLTLQPMTGEEGAEPEYGQSEGFSYDTVTNDPGQCVEQTCGHLQDSECVFKVNMVAVRDTVTSHSTEESFDPPYVLHLWPSIQLRNLLPYPITYCLQGTAVSTPTVLEAGHSCQLHTALLDQHTVELRLLDYMQQDWVAQYKLRSNQQEIDFQTFTSLSASEEAELDVGVHVRYEAGQALLALHSPYWMVNKTDRLLQYKADDVHHKHPKDYSSPLLFSFKPRNFFQNNKVRLMISDSELSDEFSIDTVGSYGDVKCKGRSKDYLVGVKIDTTSFSLTRVVTFVPFYVLENHTKHLISVCDEGPEQWTEAPPLQSAVPFWPERESKKLKVKVEGCQSTQLINFHKPENCLLLHLDNTLGGITVDVNLTEHLAVVRFSDYHDGTAPFLLINHTRDHTLQYHQSSQREIVELEAGQAVYYTWAEPTGSRVLRWSWGQHSGDLKIEEDLMEDVGGVGSLFLLSFYEGLQRVALFTQDRHLYQKICKSEKAELANQEIILALQDLGVSLVNNTTSQEVAFIGICSSDAVWEYKLQKKNRWKTLSIEDTELLEQSYREYMESNPMDNPIDDSIRTLGKYQVSFTPSGLDMMMMKPHDASLRRNFLPALRVEYKVSARQQAYRVQINHIQIQNQLPGAIFPVVYYPVKPPKSVSMDSEPKPLTDVSIITRTAGHSDIMRIKYFMVLIQEMDLRLDLGFLYALLDLFTQEHTEVVTTEQEVELFQKDLEDIKTQLNHASSTDSSPISLYEYFHISPIKLHLSFSLSSGGEDGQKEKRQTELIPVQSLNLLLKSIGATLTDVQDVVFKLAFFELTYKFNTRSQLQWEVIRHYSKQAIKQMYVLVLGLDVLGNPFGLIRGLSEGVEAFFYEPYQGAIQGPEEFVEGMALGVKALAGAAFGGLAGAASRITGAMAKGVAAMTLDEEYQQKRREAMNRQPRGIKEGLARGGKGLVSGFVSGITGIVTKPIKGAQQEGAAGFFKGFGKGLVGAVTRPTGGIIDMASSTFQGIKRATESSQDVDSLRPPRFIHDDGVIRPYREREGLGSQMLQKIENGRFAKYRYFAHAKVNESDFLMITKRGIFFVTRGTFGQLTCEWQYLFDEFTKEPLIVEDRRLRIEAKERVKSVFHAKEFGKIINFRTPEVAKWVLAKLEDARESLPKY